MRAKAKSVCVLAIGGLDPGGGAGILADARAIARAGAFACAATALLTVQSTSGLRSATAVPAKDLLAQCREVLRVQRVASIKIGALGSVDNARAIGDLLAAHEHLPSVVDTVMLPTRGRSRLLEERAVDTLRERVLRRATIVTVNAPEAAVLTGSRVTRLDEAHAAARSLLALGPDAVLVKGGHLTGAEAIDVLALKGEREVQVLEIKKPRLALPPTHGGGCTLAALVAGRLAVAGHEGILAAMRWAKRRHHLALARAIDVGGEMRVLFGGGVT